MRLSRCLLLGGRGDIHPRGAGFPWPGQLQPPHPHPREHNTEMENSAAPKNTPQAQSAAFEPAKFSIHFYYRIFSTTSAHRKVASPPFFGEFSFLAPSFRQAHLSYSRLALQAGCKSLYQLGCHVCNNLFTVTGGKKGWIIWGGRQRGNIISESYTRPSINTLIKYCGGGKSFITLQGLNVESKLRWWSLMPLVHERE